MDKRARLLGELEVTREKLDVLERQVAHVEATLGIFGHRDGKPVKAIRPYPGGYFKRGELVRLIFDLLRERGPLSVVDLRDAILERKALDPASPAYIEVRRKVLKMLERQELRGTVRRYWTEDGVVLWKPKR
ncbi:hypothetical protein [Tistlia consotensis]|nr:hypothetical protein [Tistlia consotensis]